jgi:hypothetical protein
MGNCSNSACLLPWPLLVARAIFPALASGGVGLLLPVSWLLLLVSRSDASRWLHLCRGTCPEACTRSARLAPWRLIAALVILPALANGGVCLLLPRCKSLLWRPCCLPVRRRSHIGTRLRRAHSTPWHDQAVRSHLPAMASRGMSQLLTISLLVLWRCRLSCPGRWRGWRPLFFSSLWPRTLVRGDVRASVPC